MSSDSQTTLLDDKGLFLSSNEHLPLPQILSANNSKKGAKQSSMKLENAAPSQMTGIWAVINHNLLREMALAFNW